MKNKLQLILFSSLSFRLLLSVVVILLALAFQGCSDSDYRKAVQATSAIADGLGAVQDVNAQLYDKAHLLSIDETVAIAKFVGESTRIDDALIANLKTIKSLNKSDRAALASGVQQLLASLETLNNEGVLHIKNPDARAKVSVAFAALHASIAVMQTLFADYAPLPATTNGSVIIIAPAEGPLVAVKKILEVTNESTNNRGIDRSRRDDREADCGRAREVRIAGRPTAGSGCAEERGDQVKGGGVSAACGWRDPAARKPSATRSLISPTGGQVRANLPLTA